MNIARLIVPVLLSAALLTSCGKSDGSSDSKTEENGSAAQASSSQAEVQYPRSIKLMAFGDSITEGFTYKGSYRVPLANLLEENGLSQYVDFVGKKKAGECYDNQHCGYTGYSIDPISESVTGDVRGGISGRVDELFELYTPDVVMLQIGTNDILSLYELDDAGTRLKNLVDSIFERLPEDGMLYLATIPYMDAEDNTYISAEFFTVEAMDKYVDEYNEKVRNVVEEEKAAGRNIELADVNSVISKEDLQDGVHPTKDGYEKLGEFWYGIISKYVKGE